MTTRGSLIDSTNGGTSFNNVAEFDTYKQEDNDPDNKYSEFHDVLELFFNCYFDRYNPFFKINMKAVAQWEKILCDCDIQVSIKTVPKILNREEMHLAHWNVRVAFAVDRHAEASKKLRSAHAMLYPQSAKRRRMSKDGTRKMLSDKR